MNKESNETIKSSNLCTRLAYGAANSVKLFGLGIIAGGVMASLTAGISYLAEVSELIPKLNPKSTLNNGSTTCYVEYVKQLNSLLPPHRHQTPFGFKTRTAIIKGIIGPLEEEILFRGLLQDVLLTRIPKYIVKKIAPGKETVLDSFIAKAARIILTSLAFSAIHLLNKDSNSDSYVKRQLVVTFVAGIGLGIIKESKAGLLGSIGAHMTNNFVSLAPLLWAC